MKKRGELDKSEEIEKEAEKKRHERLQLQTQKQMIHNKFDKTNVDIHAVDTVVSETVEQMRYGLHNGFDDKVVYNHTNFLFLFHL
jgi:hypothetical protein